MSKDLNGAKDLKRDKTLTDDKGVKDIKRDRRNVNIPKLLWLKCGRIAKSQNRSVSEFIVENLQLCADHYVFDHITGEVFEQWE